MRFEFATSGRILFGRGCVAEVPAAASTMGRRALLVTGRSGRGAEALSDALRAVSVETVRWGVEGEPTIDQVTLATAYAHAQHCDFVISIGGGSVIDAGKAVAALMANAGDPLLYLEVIGEGKPLLNPSAPFIAIPTTAGTGSEVSRNAVLSSPQHRVKASLRSAHMLPRLAVVDPDLTVDLPPALTASTGLDALTQLMEPYISVRSNTLTDLFCLEGIRLVARSLVAAARDGKDMEARTDMAMASLLGGMALANAGLGAVHGFAAPIGGMFDAPHGAVCAALLPYVMEANVRALRSRPCEFNGLLRFETMAQILNADKYARPEQGIAWVARACRQLEIPPLRTYGITDQDISTIVDKAAKSNSMKGNPLPLSREELTDIVSHAL
ncbi:MAG: iron-containing alcohol dehydrogenase [Bryobacteraceae bacterium]